MRRTLAIVLVLVLALSLAFPAMALAKRGGVPANDKGGPDAASAAAEHAQDAPGRDKADSSDAEEDDETTAANHGQDKDRGRSDEASATAEPKLTGVDNALSRLQRNMERMQAQLEAGTRKGLPSGLQATIAKFMKWLGIDPASGEAENTDEGSTETSGTVEPEPAEEDDEAVAGSETPSEAPAEE